MGCFRKATSEVFAGPTPTASETLATARGARSVEGWSLLTGFARSIAFEGTCRWKSVVRHSFRMSRLMVRRRGRGIAVWLSKHVEPLEIKSPNTEPVPRLPI
jgi:hypothetical protein